MTINTLKDVYVDQLQDLHSACTQSLNVLTDLQGAVASEPLGKAIAANSRGVSAGLNDLNSLIQSHGADPTGEHCKGMEGLVAEAKAHGLEADFGDSAAQDAMIITQIQRMQHYALAGYGCLVAFANRLGLDADGATLNKHLDACYDGDRTMTDIAHTEVNAAAA